MQQCGLEQNNRGIHGVHKVGSMEKQLTPGCQGDFPERAKPHCARQVGEIQYIFIKTVSLTKHKFGEGHDMEGG